MSGKKRSLCPQCGKHASGNFCHHCGSSLGGRFCNQCGAEVSGDGRFCNQCGAAVEAAPARAPGGGATAGGKTAGSAPKRRGGGASKEAAAAAGGSNNLPWWFAGVAMFALIVVVGWNMVQPAGPVAPAGGAAAPGAAGAAGAGTTDISQMSPRQAADRLFNRVMTAAQSGDSVEAEGFLPMAMQAYEMAQPLDMDGLFHLALLQRTAGQFEASLATAQQMLATEPNHILALGAAAQASVGMGEEGQAEAFYRQLIDNIDTEMARALPEYQGHVNYFDTARAEAQAFLAGR